MKFKNEEADPSLEPFWKPLEDLDEPAKSIAFENLMYMGGYKLEDGTVVHTYKHQVTRNYTNLSVDGRAWEYTGVGYDETNKEASIKAMMLDSI